MRRSRQAHRAHRESSETNESQVESFGIVRTHIELLFRLEFMQTKTYSILIIKENMVPGRGLEIARFVS